MAPTYRTATNTRRGNRGGFVEHDDFEGLPVRQWRQEWVKVMPPPPPETTTRPDKWSIEFPYGLPKDWNLLSSHSQDLLRATRSGRIHKRPAPPEEEDAEGGEGQDKNAEKKDDQQDSGVYTKVWRQVPRNVEATPLSHLAKRRKNTVKLPTKASVAEAIISTVTRATVRRVDAAGNPYEQTVTLGEGQTVTDGEVISTTVVPVPVAEQPRDFASQQVTPVKRRPPPPKRKAKGPGRGRKKGFNKLPLAPSASTGAPTSNAAEGAESRLPSDADVARREEEEEDANQDTEMADASMLQSDEDGEEGDEIDEGDGSNSGDEKERKLSETVNDNPVGNDATDSELSDALPVPSADSSVGTRSPSREALARETEQQPRGSLPAPLTNPHLAEGRHESSPLRNVMVNSPTEPVFRSSTAHPLAAPPLSEQAAPTANESGTTPESRRASGDEDSLSGVLAENGQGHVAQSDETAEPEAAQLTPEPITAKSPSESTLEAPKSTEAESAQDSPTASHLTPAVLADEPAALADETWLAMSTTNGEEDVEVESAAANEATTPHAMAKESEDEHDSLDLLGGLERELARQSSGPEADGFEAETHATGD